MSDQQAINDQINIQNDYVKIIDHTIEQQYCDVVKAQVENEKPTGSVNFDNHSFKPNFYAKNWFYGNTTEEKYKSLLFTTSIQKNLITCPLQTPFTVNFSKNCFDFFAPKTYVHLE